MASWGDSLNNYVVEKSHTAPPLEPIQRFARSTAPAWRQDPKHNFVYNTTRDPVVQQRWETESKETAAKAVNNAIAKNLRASQHGYNIVTMQPKYGISEDTVAQMGGNQELRGKKMEGAPKFINYNVITNEEVKELSHVKMPPVKVKHSLRHKYDRSTNVINHRFHRDHDAKQAQQDAELKRKLDVAAAQNLTLNPIAGHYYNPEKERQEATKQLEKEFTTRKAVREHEFPCSAMEKRSEGRTYNILTNEVHKPAEVQALDMHERRGLQKRSELRMQWELQRDVEEAVRDAQAERSVARISQKRVQDGQSCGYDILSNQEFGLTRGEISQYQPDPSLTQGKATPTVTMKCLERPTVVESLERSRQPKEMKPSSVLRAAGPRTTHEKVLNRLPQDTVTMASTFTGRKEVLVPAMPKSASSTLRSTM